MCVRIFVKMFYKTIIVLFDTITSPLTHFPGNVTHSKRFFSLNCKEVFMLSVINYDYEIT